VRLCPFLLAFYAVAAQRMPCAADAKQHRPGLYATERKLLIFAAWLTAQFRIASSVTILQQIIHLRAPGPAGRGPPLRPSGMKGQGKAKERAKRFAGMSPAEELGKLWRFFPTYAEVQTSPVLRHSIPRTRGNEC
jgi:hypothetical protein